MSFLRIITVKRRERLCRRAWHSLSAEETCAALGTSEDGLSDDEAAKRLERYGRNTLHEAKRKSVWRMIGEQLSDIMVIILFIAMVFSLVMYFIDGEGSRWSCTSSTARGCPKP